MSIEDIIIRSLKQTAVYWGAPVDDGYGGYAFDDPVEIICRWENKNEVFTDKAGNELTARSIVYSDQDVDNEGFLYLGTLDDFDSTDDITDPVTIETAYQIKRFDNLPAHRSTTEFIKKVFLSEYSG